jgi:hypothetical protein
MEKYCHSEDAVSNEKKKQNREIEGTMPIKASQRWTNTER